MPAFLKRAHSRVPRTPFQKKHLNSTASPFQHHRYAGKKPNAPNGVPRRTKRSNHPGFNTGSTSGRPVDRSTGLKGRGSTRSTGPNQSHRATRSPTRRSPYQWCRRGSLHLGEHSGNPLRFCRTQQVSHEKVFNNSRRNTPRLCPTHGFFWVRDETYVVPLEENGRRHPGRAGGESTHMLVSLKPGDDCLHWWHSPRWRQWPR